MTLRFLPKQATIKTSQFVVMRDMKLSLDAICSPSISTMLSYGITGTFFQALLYNTLISDTYRLLTGTSSRAGPAEVLRRLLPGCLWCFVREGCSTGGGLCFGPLLRPHLAAFWTARSGREPPEGPVRFASGLLAGAGCALATQWLHNAALTAGRLAAVGEREEAPHYTLVSLRRAYAELGPGLFYVNFPQRMGLVAFASAFLNAVDIFHKPELRLI